MQKKSAMSPEQITNNQGTITKKNFNDQNPIIKKLEYSQGFIWLLFLDDWLLLIIPSLVLPK